MRGTVRAILAAVSVTWAAGRLQAATATSVPPFLEDRLIYYQSFAQAEPEINTTGAEPRRAFTPAPGGVRGACAEPTTPPPLELESERFSPHRPVTVAFWWALREEPTPETGFGLFHLSGRGYVSHFSRGRGTWCALQRPAAILQVWNVPGVRNVNGIYDRHWASTLSLRAGVWHHAALVFRGASRVEVYTDGERAWSVRLRGRKLRQEDRLHTLVLGNRRGIPVALDEVMVLRRALTPRDIRCYVTAVRQMQAVRYP